MAGRRSSPNVIAIFHKLGGGMTARNGRGERIRTSDPLLPKQVRYQAALRPEFRAARAGIRLTSQAAHTRVTRAQPHRHRLLKFSRKARRCAFPPPGLGPTVRRDRICATNAPAKHLFL